MSNQDDLDLFKKVVKFLKSDSKLKPYVDDAVVLEPGKGNSKKPMWYSSDGSSNTYRFIGVKVKNTTDSKKDGSWVHFKLSGTSKSKGGAPKDAARYEEGIVLFHNAYKHHGGDYLKASKKSSKYGIGNLKTFETYLDHMRKSFDTIMPINGVGTLYHSGKASYAIKGDKYNNKTPKTDIFSPDMDISVKMGGGSQLMSGKSGDSAGVFKGSLLHYLKNGGDVTLQSQIQQAISDIESKFDEIKGQSGARDVKKRFGEWYIKERAPQIKSDAEKIKDEILKLKKPTKTQKDILKRITGDSRGKKTDVTYGTERHAKWEAMAAEMIDQRGKWKEWEIPGISANTQSMNKWLNQYVKGLDKELQEEAKGVIRLTQVHADLQRKLSSVFNNTDFKKWIVYEASTGYYKFEGRASDGSTKGPSHGSASHLLKFKPGQKITTPIPMNIGWASGLSGGVKMNLGFKSSGKSKFTALRLLQEQGGDESEFGTLFEYDMNQIQNEELSLLREEISGYEDMLNELKLLEEGLIDKFKSGFKSTLNKIKSLAKTITKKLQDAVLRFWENFKKKVIGKLVEYLKAGYEFFMDAVGLDVAPVGDSIVVKA